MSTGNAIPTREEKEDQLARILASSTLAKNQTLQQLLERLVIDHLDGKPVNEDTLGREVYGKPKGWVPMQEAVVREGMRNLRKRLNLYYRAEGHDDRLIVDFPKRTGYTPRFSYNAAADAEETVRHFESDFGPRVPRPDALREDCHGAGGLDCLAFLLCSRLRASRRGNPDVRSVRRGLRVS